MWICAEGWKQVDLHSPCSVVACTHACKLCSWHGASMGTLLQQLWRLPFYGCSMGDVVRLPEVGKSLVCCVTAEKKAASCSVRQLSRRFARGCCIGRRLQLGLWHIAERAATDFAAAARSRGGLVDLARAAQILAAVVCHAAGISWLSAAAVAAGIARTCWTAIASGWWRFMHTAQG